MRCAGSEDHGAGGFTGADTGRRVLDDKGLERRSVAAFRTEQVRVGEGLAASDGVGSDKDIGGGEPGDGDGLASVEVGSY